MLKWTVKKRFADQQNVDDEAIKTIRCRRSLGNVLAENPTKSSSKSHRRRSLGSHLNSERIKIDKENHLVTPVRRKPNRQSSTPLTDRSNLQTDCNTRKRPLVSSTALNSPTMSPISLNMKEIFVEPSSAIFPVNYAPTLPTFDVEYSPLMKKIRKSFCDELPAKRLKLDLLDLSYEFKPESASTSSPLSTPLVTRKFSNENKVTLNLSSESETSLNSSEVGDTTLQKMIDDILASARTGKKFKKCLPNPANRDRNANVIRPLNNICEDMEQKSIEKLLSPEEIAQAADKTIIIDEKASNEREVKSPTVDMFDLKTEDTCQLKRQNAVRRKNTSNENKKKKPEESQKSEQDSSIQKCLSFSSANFDDVSDKFKRSSVASNCSSSSGSSVYQMKFIKNLMIKGSLELSITTEENQKKIIIHVIRCKSLMKTNEMPQINAYVKCALVTANSSNGQQNIYQRTAVHKNSTEPVFDHKFTFNLNEPEDLQKNLQLAVWHRNRALKRSEFIGCLSIHVKNALEKNISGSFMLQPQSCLTKPACLVPEVVDEKLTKIEETFQQIQDEKDENVLLKYLELGNFKNSTRNDGRTPFTLTTTISKQDDDAFGFEISWSKPPKINSLKNNSQCSGLRKGDYIIFVGETNIVTMPKEEVIELIRRQGNCLTLEVFRPVNRVTSKDIIDNLASQSTPVAVRNTSSLSVEMNRKVGDLGETLETPKSRKSCNFKQPKICFQPTVGSGVIV